MSSHSTAVSLGLSLLAVAIWIASLQQIDLRAMTDVGLISTLPVTIFIAFALLSASFFLQLRQDSLRVPILCLHVALLIMLLYGITAVVEPYPRFAEGWRNVGFAETIGRTGEIYPEQEVYFSWPGFFVLVAFFNHLTGYPDANSFASWSPVFFNLLYVGPLLVIFRALTHDTRHIWLAVWFFFVTNWIGQDYLAPQAMAYFFFLVVVGILLHAFRPVASFSSSRIDRVTDSVKRFLPDRFYRWLTSLSIDSARSHPARPGLSLGLLGIILLLFLGIVMIQPVTPVFLFFALLALVLSQRTYLAGLPLILVVIMITWWLLTTQPFLAYNAPIVYAELGQLGSIADRNLGDRLQGSPGHVLVTRLRVVFALFVWLLAILGLARRVRYGQLDLTAAVLLVAPFPLLGFLSYGGEMVHRVYLFGLAPAAFLAAALFYPRLSAGQSRLTACILTALSVVLIVGFLTARHGNERMDSFTDEEVQAVNFVYDIAQPGSLLLATMQSTPWQHRDIEKHEHLFLGNSDNAAIAEAIALADTYEERIEIIVDIMGEPAYEDAYLIITDSQIAHSELFGHFPPDGVRGLVQAINQSGQFENIYSNSAADVFVLRAQ